MSDVGTPGDVEPERDHDHEHHHEGPGYATPQVAIEEGDRETLAYVMSLYVGTDVDAPCGGRRRSTSAGRSSQ